MIVIHYQYATESVLENKAFEEGALYFIEDTGSFYFDPVGGTKRVRIANDVNILATETDRANLLTPIPGRLYFVLNTCKQYVYFGGSWYASIDEEYVTTAIRTSETSMKQYVDQKVAGIDIGATEEYVDRKVASIEPGVDEEYVSNAIQNSSTNITQYVDQKVAGIESGVDEEFVNNAIMEATQGMIVDIPTLQEHFSTEKMILSNLQYGTELPDTGTEGQVFFKIIT